MPHFFVSSTLILVGVLGLFVISLMLFSYRSNVFVNIFLAIIFILCSVRNITIGLFEITNANTILPSKYVSPIYLIVVPSLYLYFKSLIKDYKRIHIKDLIHLFYPVLNLVLNIAQEYFPFLKNQSVENIRFISLIVFVLFYLTLSFNTIYNSLLKQKVGRPIEQRHYLLIKNWTLFIFAISSFLLLRILYSVYSEKMSGELFRAQNYSFLVIVPWLLIYGNILINPEILYGYPKLKKKVIEIQNQLNTYNHVWIYNSVHISNLQDKKLSNSLEKRILPYIADIENFVNKEHPFRDPNFSLNDFAKKMNISTSHVSYLFKYHAVVNFVEYKNYCRIKDALELINDGYLCTLTLEGLANKVGFNSYNSFFSAFKKQTNLAPNKYFSCQNTYDFQNPKKLFS